MATTLVAYADGNLTAAGSWANPLLAADASGAPFIDSEAASIGLTSTGNFYSNTFTMGGSPATVNVDGVAIKIRSRADSPSGTLRVGIYTAAGTTPIVSATINESDISTTTGATDNGWYFFKFASTALSASTAYRIGVNASVANHITIYGTSTNALTMSHYVRKAAASGAAPTTDDQMIVVGEWTAAGTQTARTITMDNTASTSFGSTTYLQSLHIGSGGTLQYGTSASTNYLLTMKGIVRPYGGGTLSIGTSGTRMPSTSKGWLVFSCAADGDSGLTFSNTGGTLNCYGYNVGYVKTIMTTTDKVATDTSLTVADSTGWVSGDEIAIPSTSTTLTNNEKRTVSSTLGTTVNIDALSYPHTATGNLAADVGLLTRNVRIYGTDATHRAYIDFGKSATVHVEYAELYFMGTGTAGKRGIENGNIYGNISFTYSTIRDSVYAFYSTLATGSIVNLTLEHNVFYNNSFGIYLSSTGLGSTGITLNDNLIIKQVNNNANVGMIQLQTANATVTNNILAGCDVTAAGIHVETSLGTISGNKIYALGQGLSLGVSAISKFTPTISNTTIARCPTGIATGICFDSFINTATIVGCGNGVVLATGSDNNTFTSLTINGEASYATTYSVRSSNSINNRFINGSFSQTVAATTDVNVVQGTNSTFYFDNCLFGTSPEYNFAVGGYAYPSTRMYSNNHNQIDKSYKFVNQGTGVGTSDTTQYDTSPSSLRLTPATQTAATSTSSPLKFESPSFKVAVKAGQTFTVTVKVREDSAYASDNPHARLIQKANSGVGFNADVVLDTWAAAADAWDTLTGTVTATRAGIIEFVIDCSGNTGYVNVDTWTAEAIINDTKNLDYALNGHPQAWSNNSRGSAATFYDSKLYDVQIN